MGITRAGDRYSRLPWLAGRFAVSAGVLAAAGTAIAGALAFHRRHLAGA